MKYICISNKGEIDINAFKLIGASSKRDSNTKIGFFGSGLKYGIAVLLREQIELKVFTGEREVVITTEKVMMRETEHENICIDGTPTGFTVGMGPSWKLWFALREIYCNALDEDNAAIEAVDEIESVPGYTQFYLGINDELQSILDNFNHHFTKNRTDLLFEKDNNYIYASVGNRINLYRKGIRCYDDNQKSMFDYDIDKIKINESRVIESTWDMKIAISRIIKSCNSEDIIRSFLFDMWQRKDRVLEYDLYFDNSVKFDPLWREVIGTTPIIPHESSGHYTEDYNLLQCVVLPKEWIVALRNTFPDIHLAGTSGSYDGVDYQEVEMGNWEINILKQVKAWYKEVKLDAVLDPEDYDIRVVKFRQPDILGMAPKSSEQMQRDEQRKALGLDDIAVTEKRVVLLSKRVFDLGKVEVASTLFEEMVHHNYGVKDKTRAMQTQLINCLVAYAQKLNCYPL